MSSLNLEMTRRSFIAYTLELKPNDMLRGDFQLTTHIKVIPGELSLLWQEESMADCSHEVNRNIYLTKSEFNEKSSHCVYYLISMGESFLPHGGFLLFENRQIRISLSCIFETLAAACIFASLVPGEPLNLL